MKKLIKVLLAFVLFIAPLSLMNGKEASAATYFKVPATGVVTAYYMDPTYGGDHYGHDIANGLDTPVVASAAGKVITASIGYNNGYGNYVVLEHNINGNKFFTLYAHLNNIKVSVGSTVSQGQLLGGMGNTGEVIGVTGIHVHFELRKNVNSKYNAVDPRPYFNGTVDLGVSDDWHLDPVSDDSQIGWLLIKKPINVYKKVDGKLVTQRILQPDQKFRVYGFSEEFGGQYRVGGGEFVTQMEGYVEYRDAPVLWDNKAMFPGEIGRIDVEKAINVYTRDGSSLTLNRIAQPGDLYRVFSYDTMHGGQYHIGNGLYITNMPDYINYRTPSKELIEKAARQLGTFPKN